MSCRCGASYNAFGQRLRDDWAANPSWSHPEAELDDLEGFELASLASEAELDG